METGSFRRRECVQGEIEEFEWTKPRLSTTGLADLELSKWFVRLVVNETLLKLLAQGKASHDMVVAISSALHTELNKALQTHATMSSIMQLAVEEILYIVDVLFVLVEHKNSNVGAKAVAMLDKLRMKQSTTIQIFATLLFKNPWWQQAEQTARQRACALMSFSSEIQDAEEMVKKGELEWSKVTAMASRLAVWQEGVPSGAHCKISL